MTANVLADLMGGIAQLRAAESFGDIALVDRSQHAPQQIIIVLIAMLVYMQVEAYVMTPKVMGKAVQVPGTIVLISALAGGTLLGLLGALVAIPISAGILLIIREVVVPKQASS